MISVYCKNIEETLSVEGGATLAEIAAAIGPRLDFAPICCRVNNKTEGLDYAVYQPKIIEFQSRTTGSGPRVYTRSLCMMLYAAVESVVPGTRLVIEHSISHGYYCRLFGVDEITDSLVDAIKHNMLALSGADFPFVKHQLPTPEVEKLFEERGLHSKAELLQTTRELFATFYTLGDICDSYYGALATSTGIIDVCDLQRYNE
ncbi:MAG: nucleoside kinase, partial [Muribaculaceae bacterium]|nr:nucleoside kinase [Muribaculaceae bacterium]